MEEVLVPDGISTDQNRRISEILAREQAKLRQFIRKRVPNEGDAEDIFQDVFYELVAAYRLMKPVEQAGAWLFRVARNRIIDLFRHKRPVVLEIFVRRREIQLHSGVHCVAERLLYYCLDVGGVRTIVPQVCC